MYVQSDTLLLADITGNFRNKCIEIYVHDPSYFLSASGLAWQACLKNTEVELELLTSTGMLLMVEKGIRGGISHALHRYAKANNKYMKNYDENIKSLCLIYLDGNNLRGWAMYQKLPVNDFEWVKKLSKFEECFIKSYEENSGKGYFLEVDAEYQKTLFNLHSDLPFLPKRQKIEKCNKLVCTMHDKKNYVVYIRALKETINYGLILKKVHRVIQFNQEAWLKALLT